MASAAEEARRCGRHRDQVVAYLKAAEVALKHDALERVDEHLARWQLELDECQHYGGNPDEVYALEDEMADLRRLQSIMRGFVLRLRLRVEEM